MTDVTQLLSAIDRGDLHASEQLLPLVYDELRQLARGQLANEKPGQTLQPTALVHEAYLRVVGSHDESWNSRGHFYSAAAEAMRRILVESARRKQRIKHGAKFDRVPLNETLVIDGTRSDEIVAVSESLEQLAAEDPQAADLVKLRYFAGLTQSEAADALGLPRRTTDRLWAYAKAWLHRELQN